MSWRARQALTLALTLAVAACGKSGRGQRDRDAPPVVMVEPGQGGVPVDEHEPNPTPAQATPLPIGGVGRGVLDGSADVDVFALTVAQTGMLTLRLDGVDGVDLLLEVVDASGVVLARSDRGPAKTGEGVPNLGVAKGTYYAVVREFVKPAARAKTKTKPKKGQPDAAPPPPGRTGPSPTYQLRASLAPTGPGAEREPDDDAATANELVIGDVVTGFVGWTGDVDVWKLAIEALTTRNAYDVELAAVDGVALTLEVRDGAGVLLLTRKGGRGAAVAVRGVVPASDPTAGAFHTLTVRGDRSNPEAGYQLTVRGRLLAPDDETEPNDKREQAQALPGGSGVMHATLGAGEVDHFAVPPAADAQQLDVVVRGGDGLDVVIEVVAAAGLVARADAGAASAGERLEQRLGPGDTVWIVVSAKAVKGDTGLARDYELTWTLGPAEDLPLPPEEGGEPAGEAPLPMPPEEPAGPTTTPGGQ